MNNIDIRPHKNNEDRIKYLCYCHYFIKINKLSYYSCKACNYEFGIDPKPKIKNQIKND